MDRVEVRRMVIAKHWALTYEEWYAINRDAFELVRNAYLPCDLYQEYLEEEVDRAYEMINGKA